MAHTIHLNDLKESNYEIVGKKEKEEKEEERETPSAAAFAQLFRRLVDGLSTGPDLDSAAPS
jgi:hypothetical protein